MYNFCKTYDHQIWQACTSTEFNSSKANQAGTGDVITSRSRNKLKQLHLHYHSVDDTKLGMMVTYLEELQIIKPNNALIKWSCEIT